MNNIYTCCSGRADLLVLATMDLVGEAGAATVERHVGPCAGIRRAISSDVPINAATGRGLNRPALRRGFEACQA